MASDTKVRRKDLPENRRACILKAARCVFARQGYDQTVVEDIAGQAGIGKGTLYLYFRSKEDIYLAALGEDARRLEELTRERMQSAENWQGKLQAYVDVRLEYLDRHPDFLRIYLSEFRSRMVRGDKLPPQLFECFRESEGRLAQVFASAIARREIREVDADLAAVTLVDMTRGVMERRLLGWSPHRVPDDAHFALGLFCRALQAD